VHCKDLFSNGKDWLFSVLDIEYILHALHKVHCHKIKPMQADSFKMTSELLGAALVCDLLAAFAALGNIFAGVLP